MNEASLLATLGCLKPGVNEIMVHPGFSDFESGAYLRINRALISDQTVNDIFFNSLDGTFPICLKPLNSKNLHFGHQFW